MNNDTKEGPASQKAAVKKKAAKKIAAKKPSAINNAFAAVKAAVKARELALKAILKAQASPAAAAAPINRGGVATAPAAPQLSNPSKAEVKPKVIRVIAEAAIVNSAPHANVLKLVSGDENLDLADDLNLDDDSRERLSGPYTKISQGDYGGAGVGKKESRKAKKVGAAITLVHEKANKK